MRSAAGDPPLALPSGRRAELRRGAWNTLRRTPEFGVAVFLVLAILAIDVVVHRVRGDTGELSRHLGAEYFNIARALADGRGYSDPFAERTGPTAWMPPLFPSILAVLLLVAKTRAAAAAVVVALVHLTLVAIGTAIYGIARRCRQRVSPLVSVGLYLTWVAAFDYWMLLLTHDVWLLAAGATALACAVYAYVVQRSMRPWRWGLLGGLLTLTSPALALAWGCMVLLFFLSPANNRRGWIAAAALALTIAAPWTIRNAVVFHRFIPVKSNLFFEAYQANYVDDDGIYDVQTQARHPFGLLSMRFEYAQKGEVRYLADYRRRFFESLAKEPGEFARKVGNRAVSSLLLYTPVDKGEERGLPLAARRFVCALPVLLFLASVWIRGPNRRLQLTWAFMVLTYLLPYVVIAFYVRYLLPVAPVLVLIAFVGIDRIAWRFSGGAGAGGEPTAS